MCIVDLWHCIIGCPWSVLFAICSILMYGLTPSYVWPNSCIIGYLRNGLSTIWVLCTNEMPPTCRQPIIIGYLRYGSFVFMTWLLHHRPSAIWAIYNMGNSYLWHDSYPQTAYDHRLSAIWVIHMHDMNPTKWWRPIECLILIGHFLQKSPIIGGCFAERDLQVEASCAFSPPCNVQVHVQSWRSRIDVCDVMRNTFVSSVVLHLKNATHTHTHTRPVTYTQNVCRTCHTHTHTQIYPTTHMQYAARHTYEWPILHDVHVYRKKCHTRTHRSRHTHTQICPTTHMQYASRHTYEWPTFLYVIVYRRSVALRLSYAVHTHKCMPYTHTNVSFIFIGVTCQIEHITHMPQCTCTSQIRGIASKSCATHTHTNAFSAYSYAWRVADCIWPVFHNVHVHRTSVVLQPSLVAQTHKCVLHIHTRDISKTHVTLIQRCTCTSQIRGTTSKSCHTHTRMRFAYSTVYVYSLWHLESHFFNR